MTATTTYKQANLFAAALDADDFTAAEALLSPKCVSVSGREVLEGREAIINSYRKSSERAQELFDTVFYESDVLSSSETSAEILFADQLSSGEMKHIYRSRHFLEFSSAGEIVQIRQEEIAGERQRLKAFIEECGVDDE
ncbi:MAG: hypothetical protein BMS9Abin02_1506 [Anaerolineae bacterium]|nr:MAG: hypothetical protein BMS9Abin02_1506 [Anaerolineae bacterium]